MKYKQPDKPTFTHISDVEYLKMLKDIKRLAKKVTELKAMKKKKGIPFIAVGNDELVGKDYHAGDMIKCPTCHKQHELIAAKNKDGLFTETLLSYQCKGKHYLYALCNKRLP